MTAQALQANLPELSITLVEASDIPTVGVGEATLNTLHGFLLPAGIHEDEFLYETSGSIKLGILYRGWSDRDYWHPFGEVVFPPAFLNQWIAQRVEGCPEAARSTTTAGSGRTNWLAPTGRPRWAATRGTTPAPSSTAITWTPACSPRR